MFSTAFQANAIQVNAFQIYIPPPTDNKFGGDDVGITNQADFITYRGILRGLVSQPQVNPDFPIEPTPIWS